MARAVALAAWLAASPALAETSGPPIVIETRPLKLIGDGAALAPPPARSAITIETPPLRLIGGAAPADAPQSPAPAITIQTLPLKLFGAKP